MNDKARSLRKNQTDAEALLWHHLRSRQILKCKFRRQHAIGAYIADLVCIERKVIVEVDGGQHMEQQSYDDQRTAYLPSLGYRVLRFWNNEVLKETEAVLQVIHDELRNDPSPPPSPPVGGEGVTRKRR